MTATLRRRLGESEILALMRASRQRASRHRPVTKIGSSFDPLSFKSTGRGQTTAPQQSDAIPRSRPRRTRYEDPRARPPASRRGAAEAVLRSRRAPLSVHH